MTNLKQKQAETLELMQSGTGKSFITDLVSGRRK